MSVVQTGNIREDVLISPQRTVVRWERFSTWKISTRRMTSHCIYNVMTASDVPWICSVYEEDMRKTVHFICQLNWKTSAVIPKDQVYILEKCTQAKGMHLESGLMPSSGKWFCRFQATHVSQGLILVPLFPLNKFACSPVP